MTLLLLALAAASIGWFVHDLTFDLLSRFERRQQALRLQNLVAASRKKPPFQTLLLLIEEKFQTLLKMAFFRRYFEFLAGLLLRMNHPDLKPVQIFGYQILLSLGASLLFGLLSESLELSLLAFLLGGLLPVLWLRDKASLREKKILRELPNVSEILSLCSEAGLSLELGMGQYLKNAKPGPLREEFAGLLEQMKSGSSRKNALEATASRINLTDFSLFTTSLIQAERFGTGVAKTLRQLSLTLRDKQSQRAEKAVQELPVKMLLPLILFIMPVTFLIIFGPVLLQFLKP
jgi:tight adherence protein C